MVHPERQRAGIGTALLRDLLGELPVWRIMLVADAEAAPFYQRLGFAPLPDAHARFQQRYLHDASSLSAPKSR